MKISTILPTNVAAIFTTATFLTTLILSTAPSASGSIISVIADNDEVMTLSENVILATFISTIGSPIGLIGTFCVFIVDPLNVEEFQLDVQFNPDDFTYAGIRYVDPFVEKAPPDLSQLNLGFIRDIAGITSLAPAGEVDIFEVYFRFDGPVVPTSEFSAFASSNDFAIGFNPDTGQRIIFGPNQIIAPGIAAHIPEPTSTLGLLALGTLGAASTLKRKLKPSKKDTIKVS